MSDYISREDALKLAYKSGEGDGTDMIVDARDIEDIPAADVAPVVRGEWTRITNPYGELEVFMHIACGRTSNEMSDYCPNCGANMQEVAHD